MSKFTFPKFPVSRWDETTKAYIACGSITAINVRTPDYGINLANTRINNPSHNTQYADTTLPASFFRQGAAKDEFLARMKYKPSTRLQTIAYSSNIDVTVQLDGVTPLTNTDVYLLFKVKFTKPILDKVTLTILDLENVEITARKRQLNYRTDSLYTYGAGQPIVNVMSETTSTDVVYENLYNTRYDADGMFVATQVRFTGKYPNPSSDVVITLGVDLELNTLYYITYNDIITAYYNAKGKYPGSNLRLIIRTITSPIVVKSTTVNMPEAASADALYNYSVGIITGVKNFALSEDGFTITGKFNATCNIAMTFNNNAPINFTTESNGSFSYTGSINMNVGGQLTLLPSNLIGPHTSSVLTIADKVAPLDIANATVTSVGIYGNAEIGSTIKVYDEYDVLIDTYTVPANGLVEIKFIQPIPSDVQYKLYRYSIADKAGNILGQQLLEYTGSISEITGPIYSENIDYSGVRLVNITSAKG